MNDLRDILKGALAMSSRNQGTCIFPTILAGLPEETLRLEPGTTMADIAMALLDRSGFKSDRTRMNLHGYPALFRELKDPPPWIEVTPEDVEGPISDGRATELRALYLLANETSLRELLDRYREHIEQSEEQRKVLVKLGIPSLPEQVQFLLEKFEEKLLLTRCLGTDDFEQLYDTVFDFDEFTPAVGAPDLFVWNSDIGIWFFAEVKGPNDHLRKSQVDWVQEHWESIRGRFVLLVISPDA